MKIKLLIGLAAIAALVACGDDTGTGGGGSPATGGGGSGAGTSDGAGGTGGTGAGTDGGGGSGGGEVELTCETGCDALYTCGLEEADGAQLCEGFTGEPADRETFVTGCIPGCEDQMALLAVINPDDCPATINFVRQAAAKTFAPVCDNGVGQGGGGGGAP